MPISDTQWAYAAGWFEARGYIRIGCQLGRTPRLTVYIQMPEQRSDWFKEAFPGSTVYLMKSTLIHHKGGKMHAISGNHRWSIARLPALEFLRGIQPYLQYRKDFVAKGIDFIERVVVKGEKYNLNLAAFVEEIRAVGNLNK